jgi:hypothetical protein
MRLRLPAALAATAVLALGAAACGSDGGSESTGSRAAAAPEPVAQVDQLTGESTDVILDAGFVGALEDLKLTPGPVGEASIEEGTVSFPITGGNVIYYKPGSVSPFVQGELSHAGGLSLEGGGKTVELTDFVIDPGASVLTGTVSVDGEVAAESAPLFFLDGGTLEPLEVNDDGTAVLQGTTVELKAEAAELLNDTFAVDALQEGLKIGTARITINT